MEKDATERQIEYLSGLVAGLQAAVRGLIASHPAPEHAIRQVALCVEDAMAAGLASGSTSEHQLLGVERTLSRLLPTEVQIDPARSP